MKRVILAVLAGFALVLTGASLASATTEGSVTVEHGTSCGTAFVTIHYAKDYRDSGESWKYGVTVEVDGIVAGTTGPIGPGTSTFPLTFDEDYNSGVAGVSYYLTDATEWDIVPADLNYQATYPEVGDKFRSFEVVTECSPPELIVVTPVEPTLTQPTCEVKEPTLTVPETPGVVYTTEGTVTPGHAVTVTATPAEGYVFAGDEQEIVYTFDIAAVPGCDGPPGEPGTPAEPGDKGDPGKDGKDAEDAKPAPAATDDEPKPLPDTGFPVGLALLGLGLTGAGGLLRKLAR
jgi:hypothetical protein